MKLWVLPLALVAVVLVGVSSHSRPNERWAQIQQRADAGDEDAKRRLEFFTAAGVLPADPASGFPAPYRQNCCGQADAYETDDVELGPNGETIAILTCNEPQDCEAIRGKIVRPAGTKVIIPENKILIPGRPINNTGHGWVFLNAAGGVLCYSRPSGT